MIVKKCKKMLNSKNPEAERIVGKREPAGMIIDFPCELGYHCPKCKYKNIKKGEYDTRLHWSEYNGFLWCEVCNMDYPTCLCAPLEIATKLYLSCIKDGIDRARNGIIE